MKKKKEKKFRFGYLIAFCLMVTAIACGAITFYDLKYPVKYQEYITKYTEEYSLDKTLVCSLINEESSFDASAVSSKGAIGLMQITSKTGEYIAGMLNEEYSEESLYDPETNIRYGCFYLNYLRSKFVDKEVYLSAYNAGESTVNLWLNNKNLSSDGVTLNVIPYKITREYTSKILFNQKYYNGRI